MFKVLKNFLCVSLIFSVFSCYYVPVPEVQKKSESLETESNKTKSKKSIACSKKWILTGYFTPVEKDFKSKVIKTIRVKNQGYKTFSYGFLKAVKMEGWGRTNKGWYLGYYSKKWHKSLKPLDAYGKKLVIGVIATDTKLIPKGTRITIPSLPKPLNTIVFTAKDTGGRIKGKHIDLYTGEGKSAEKITYLITGKKHKICIN
ncbi:MAG: hypothetical protein GY714_21435 [Desulfobacterales bacterium]|nr:hypothetical protein [Desulfobacterales bacterium]MCP4161144.1 hypothetical protein [Deltaproteobacteria bacterium]